MIQAQENGEKLHFGPHLGPLGPNSGCHFFPQKIWLTRHHCQLSPCTMSEKTIDPILKKFSDGWTDRQRRQTGQTDFIGTTAWLTPNVLDKKLLSLCIKQYLSPLHAALHLFEHQTLIQCYVLKQVQFSQKTLLQKKPPRMFFQSQKLPHRSFI